MGSFTLVSMVLVDRSILAAEPHLRALRELAGDGRFIIRGPFDTGEPPVTAYVPAPARLPYAERAVIDIMKAANGPWTGPQIGDRLAKRRSPERAVNFTAASASPTLGRLLKKGLVTREGPHRLPLYRLTPKGRAA